MEARRSSASRSTRASRQSSDGRDRSQPQLHAAVTIRSIATSADEIDTSSALGARFREAREARELSLAEVAQRAGLTKGFLSKFERGGSSVAVGTLMRLCEVVDVSPSSLFDAPATFMQRGSDAPRAGLGVDRVEDRLLTPGSQTQVQLVRATFEPGARDVEFKQRFRADIELVHVVSGSLEVNLESKRLRLKRGDSVTYDAKALHTWSNPSDSRSAVAIWVVSLLP